MTNTALPSRAALPKRSLINIVRWIIFIESTLTGIHCGFLKGGVGGAIVGSIIGAVYGLVIMVWLSCLE
jgi:hypothetical protein